MKNLIRALLLVALLPLAGCTSERVSIVESKWVSKNEQVEFVLLFKEFVCVAIQNSSVGGVLQTEELTKNYSYNTPKVFFYMPNNREAVGVFYDNYTRLEVSCLSVDYTFFRTK